MGFANQFHLPYGYYGTADSSVPRADILQGESDIPQYQEAISFWNESRKAEHQRVLTGMKTTEHQRARATRNQQLYDQRAVDGQLNRGGFIVDDSLPMAFESKLELYAQFYGGAGMPTTVPEQDRQDIIKMRIQSLEEQDQVAELNDPSIEEGASELEQVQESQMKIGNLLRLINAQLVGGLIDKSILSNLSQIADILGEWGYTYGTSYLSNLRTQLLEEPGVADPDQLESYRQRESGEVAPEGQSALITAISSFAKSIDTDIIGRLLSDDYQSRNIEERKIALGSIVSEFRKKTYSQLAPESGILPRTKQEAINKIMDIVDFYVENGDMRIFDVLEIDIFPGFEYNEQERNEVIRILRKKSKDYLVELYSRLAGAGGLPPYGGPEFEFPEQVGPGEQQGFIDIPGEILEAPIESAEAVIPGQIEFVEPLELPGGEAESKEEEPAMTLEEMMERRRRGETSEPAAAPPRRPRRAIPRRPRPSPASAAQSSFGEELGERLAEESFRE